MCLAADARWSKQPIPKTNGMCHNHHRNMAGDGDRANDGISFAAGESFDGTSFEAEESIEARYETKNYNADSITTLESESEGAGVGEDESNKNICDKGEYQTSIVILIEFSMNRGLICRKHGAPIIMQKASVVLIGVKDFEAS